MPLPPVGGAHVCVWRMLTAPHQPLIVTLGPRTSFWAGPVPHSGGNAPRQAHTRTHPCVCPKPSPVLLPALGDASPEANQDLHRQEVRR